VLFRLGVGRARRFDLFAHVAQFDLKPRLRIRPHACHLGFERLARGGLGGPLASFIAAARSPLAQRRRVEFGLRRAREPRSASALGRRPRATAPSGRQARSIASRDRSISRANWSSDSARASWLAITSRRRLGLGAGPVTARSARR
jgi:hypothetical protein